MIFDKLELLDSFEVEIMDDPYTFLMSITEKLPEKTGHKDYHNVYGDIMELVHKSYNKKFVNKPMLCLPLYSRKGHDKEKYVPEKSGLNQWNASGRVRDVNEIYIPYQAEDRRRDTSFFPPRDTSFTLHLPDGKKISAKVCQGADKNNPLVGKSIMSNPNSVLGKWLLRDVFEVEEGTLITYEMLEMFGVDSVVFIKNNELDYSIDFADIGTYERFYEEED